MIKENIVNVQKIDKNENIDKNDKNDKDISNLKNENNSENILNDKEKIIKERMISFLSQLEKLLNDINSVKDAVNKQIEDENKFEKYIILNKKYYNNVTKIFESNEIYDNDNILFTNLSNITDIESLDPNTLLEKDKLFEERKNKLNDRNSVHVDFEKIEIDKEIIKYPKEFIIIKENILKEFLSNYEIKDEDIKSQTYNIILGANHIFIEDNLNQKNIFICNNIENALLNVEAILKYNEMTKFKKELKHLIVKKSYDNYIMIRNINLNKKIQDIIDRENEYIGKFIIVIKSNPFIRVLFFVLSTITKLNIYFKNFKFQINDKNLSGLFASYFHAYNNNLIETHKIINKAEILLKQSKNDLNYSDFKELIKIILNILDNELSSKKKNKEINIIEFDQTFAFNKFQEAVDIQYDSIIYKLFFGNKKIISNYQKCHIENYSYKLFKYLYFKIEKDSPTEINTLIEAYNKRLINSKGDCGNCSKIDEDLIRRKEIYSYPEILIIIFDNPNKIKFFPESSLKLKEDEFNLISCINKSNTNDDLRIIFKENKNYFVYDNDEKKEIDGDIKDLISDPYFTKKKLANIKKMKKLKGKIDLQASLILINKWKKLI